MQWDNPNLKGVGNLVQSLAGRDRSSTFHTIYGLDAASSEIKGRLIQLRRTQGGSAEPMSGSRTPGTNISGGRGRDQAGQGRGRGGRGRDGPGGLARG